MRLIIPGAGLTGGGDLASQSREIGIADGGVTPQMLGSYFTTIQNGSLPVGQATFLIQNIPGIYSELVLYANNVTHTGVAQQPFLRASADNGSTFLLVRGFAINSVGSTTLTAMPGADVMLREIADQAAGQAWAYAVRIRYQTGLLNLPSFSWGLERTGVVHMIMPYGSILSGSRINALRLEFSNAGTFASGTYALLGVR